MHDGTSGLKVHIPKLCKHPNGQGFIYIARQPVYLGRWNDPGIHRLPTTNHHA